MEEETTEKNDWRDILKKLNQQIKQVEELPKEPEKTKEVVKECHSKDFVDIKLNTGELRSRNNARNSTPRLFFPVVPPGETESMGPRHLKSQSQSQTTAQHPG